MAPHEVHRPPLLPRRRQGRPLRRIGTAGDFRRRGPRGHPGALLTTDCNEARMTGITRDDTGSEPVMRLVASDEEKALRDSVAQIGQSFGHAYYMQQVRERGSA